MHEMRNLNWLSVSRAGAILTVVLLSLVRSLVEVEEGHCYVKNTQGDAALWYLQKAVDDGR